LLRSPALLGWLKAYSFRLRKDLSLRFFVEFTFTSNRFFGMKRPSSALRKGVRRGTKTYSQK
jgi:hypothetical protein